MGALTAYSSLFITALIATTIFPAQSEALLVVLLLADSNSLSLLHFVATVGNVTESMINWWPERGAERLALRR